MEIQLEPWQQQMLTDYFHLLSDQLKEQRRIRWLLDTEDVFGEEKPE